MKMSKRALTNTSTNTITSSKEDSATFAAKNKDENAAEYLSFLDGGYIHASIAVAFSDLIIMNMLIAGTRGP